MLLVVLSSSSFTVAANKPEDIEPRPGVPPLNLRTIDRSTNLPSDNVNFIFQDKAGLVWICSDKTVSHILPWGEVSAATPDDGLLHTPVLTMGQTSDGWLYIGTQQGGLYSFDGTRYNRILANRLGERTISQMVSDDNNNLYLDIGHEVGVLTQTKQYIPLVQMGQELNYKLLKLPTGQVMLASKGGYRLLGQKTSAFTPYPAGYENCLPVASTLGGIVFQRGDMLVVMNLVGDQLLASKTMNELGRHISAALMLPDGRWLMGYRDLGMVLVDGNNRYRYTSTNSLLGNYVKTLFLDRENSVWIGQFGNGIQHMSEHYLWFYPKQAGFEEFSLTTIAGAPDGQFYAAATSSRFYLIKNHVINSIKDTALTNIRAMHFLTPRRLVALSELGVFQVDIVNEKEVKTKLLGHIRGGLDLVPSDETQTHFFVSTTTSLYSLTDQAVKRLVDYPAGAAISKVRRLGQDFYALGKNGVAIKLSHEGQILRIWEQRQGVPKTSINDLAFDHIGRCWLATDSGLYQLDNDNQKFRLYKSYRQSYGLLFNYKASLWAMSEKTLYQRKDTGWFKTNSYKTISNEKGAINLAKFYTSTNQILMATSRGMVISNLDRWKVYKGQFQMIYLSSNADGGFWERSQAPRLLRVHEGIGYVRWKYQITDYNCNGDVRFYIQTVKNGDTTYAVTSNKDFSLTKPESGKYSFTIYGLGQDGVKTNNQLRFELIVIPVWYKQGWFIFLVSTLLVGLIWISAQGYSTYLYRQKMREIKTIQRIQAERERISRDLHDSVGSQLVYMVNALEQVRRADSNHKPSESHEAAHERFADKLKELTDLARTTIQNLRESIWVLHQGGEIDLNNFVDRLRRYFDQVKAIAHIRIQENVKIEADAKLTPVQALNLFRIVQEAVTNAAKHSETKLIAFDLIQTDDMIQLKVQDFGKGFIQNISESKGNRSPDSYGLTNMQYRADEINAELKILSIAQEGTTISLDLNITQR